MITGGYVKRRCVSIPHLRIVSARFFSLSQLRKQDDKSKGLNFLNMVFILSVTFCINEYLIGMISLSIFSALIILTVLKVRRALSVGINS